MKNISILGSTGSIGTQALEIISMFPEKFSVVGLSAGRNIALLKEQIEAFNPVAVAVEDQQAASELRKLTGNNTTEILYGNEGYMQISTLSEADTVISSIVGSAGLLPTYAAITKGKDICLANKESLVVAGSLLIEMARQTNSQIIPIDSEHSAIFQALRGYELNEVKKLIITASGGPFRDTPVEQLENVTVSDALKHPTWKMGKKITIDSATLMNKGFEVIEAKWFFGLPVESISVWIHPQSIVHSMVEFIDGSIISQLSIPDMKIPIAYALSYPERLDINKNEARPVDYSSLTFAEVDYDKFYALKLAFEALREGGTMLSVLNASNEVAVNAFLEGKIKFTEITRIIEKVMENHDKKDIFSIEELMECDNWARSKASTFIN